MKAWILLSTLILLAGCTSVQYVKAGSTDADFEDDKAECTQQILKATIEANLAAAESSGPYEKASTTPSANAPLRQRIEQCLQSTGWRRESRSE